KSIRPGYRVKSGSGREDPDVAVAMDLAELDDLLFDRSGVRLGIGQHQLFRLRVVDAVSFHIEVVVVADDKGHLVELLKPTHPIRTATPSHQPRRERWSGLRDGVERSRFAA